MTGNANHIAEQRRVDSMEKTPQRETLEASQPAAAPLNVNIRENLGSISEGLNHNETVSESASENASENYSGSQSGASSNQGDDKRAIADLQEQLKASQPKKSKMINEVKSALRKEEFKLTLQAFSAKRNLAFDKLAEIVAKIRDIHLMLEELAYATYDMIKNMWLKVVHNIAV